MALINENDVLFDDVALLNAALVEGSLSISSVNANCDCVSYTSVGDEEEIDTATGARSFAAAN
ncbi:hypothetical protein LXM25_05815 [Dyadobacter sp. LJ53]|uniref:hypothetical protein n=1 Tax=Dyadobacter chenwenxiniae TaxID=2906456 RepID=UPI001F3C98F5|nr:hypothetical protein [Dyadobacter chenwenxiniae]MCF0049560.1 hypothetical protein [Dyadobacter chenwenxiniae]